MSGYTRGLYVEATLERHQIAIYFAAVFAGLLIAALAGDASAALGRWINPALAAVLYATLLQVPLRALRKAFGEGRFLVALLVANFVAVPLVVLALIQFLELLGQLVYVRWIPRLIRPGASARPSPGAIGAQDG